MPSSLGKTLGYLLLAILTLVCLFPLGWALLTSLKTSSEIFENPYGWPDAPTLQNYASAWTIGRFSTYTLNTLALTIPTVLLVIGLSVPVGFALAKGRLPGSRLILLLFLVGLMVPVHGFMVPMFYNLNDLGLINTRTGAVLSMTATYFPIAVYMMRNAVLDIPDEIFESARMDGAGPARMLRDVVFPLVKPTSLALGALITVWSWNELLVPLLVLQLDDLRPISVGLTFFNTRYSVDHALTAAGSVIAALPLLVIYVVLQRQFVSGLVNGAVKG